MTERIHKDKATFFSLSEACSVTGTIFDETRGKRLCCRFLARAMHMLSGNDLNSAELETVRVSESPTTVVTADGEVQRKWGSNSARPLPRVIRDSVDPRGHASSPTAEKTLRRTRILVRVGQWSKTTSYQTWQKHPMQHGELCADRCPRIINRFFQFECKYISYIVSAGHVWWIFVTSSNYTTLKCKHSSTGRPVARSYRNPKHIKIRTLYWYSETCCEICQNGWRISPKI